jgi:hypothetical protein
MLHSSNSHQIMFERHLERGTHDEVELQVISLSMTLALEFGARELQGMETQSLLY